MNRIAVDVLGMPFYSSSYLQGPWDQNRSQQEVSLRQWKEVQEVPRGVRYGLKPRNAYTPALNLAIALLKPSHTLDAPV